MPARVMEQPLKITKPKMLASEAPWLPIAMILFLTFLVYSGTLWFQFVYDDRGQILANAQVHYWRFAPGYFFEGVWNFAYPRVLGNYYRPVFLLFLLINYKLFGPYPAGWHLVSVGVQVAVTFLVYRLVGRLVGDRRTALIAALIFGLTPVHIESVAWVSGVTDPLLALFLIPSFLCYLNGRERSRERRWWLARLRRPLWPGNAGQRDRIDPADAHLCVRMVLVGEAGCDFPVEGSEGPGLGGSALNNTFCSADVGLPGPSMARFEGTGPLHGPPGDFHDLFHLAQAFLLLLMAPGVAFWIERVL